MLSEKLQVGQVRYHVLSLGDPYPCQPVMPSAGMARNAG